MSPARAAGRSTRRGCAGGVSRLSSRRGKHRLEIPRPSRARAIIRWRAYGSFSVMVLDGEVMREIGEGGGASRPKPRAAPPSKIQCPRCNHWKHPRASTCKQTGCDCECSKHQQGIKKKRQFAQITARDGLWDASVQRRLIHQVRLTCLPRARTGEPRRGSARNAPAINSISQMRRAGT